MSRFRDSPYPVAHYQWVEGVKAPTNCPEATVLGASHIARVHIAKGVYDARINGECRVQTAVSLILGYKGAMSHFAASITKGVFNGNLCYQKTVDSKTAAMDEGRLGQMAQEPHSFENVDHPWTFNCLGGPTVQS
ncbi:hypothetical protein [Nitrospira sp. M1]